MSADSQEHDAAPLVKTIDAKSARTIANVLLAILAVGAALYFTRELLVPIMFAILLNACFQPILRWLNKFHIPQALSALIVVLGLLALLSILMWVLAKPVRNWVAQAPQYLADAERKLDPLRRPLTRA